MKRKITTQPLRAAVVLIVYLLQIQQSLEAAFRVPSCLLCAIGIPWSSPAWTSWSARLAWSPWLASSGIWEAWQDVLQGGEISCGHRRRSRRCSYGYSPELRDVSPSDGIAQLLSSKLTHEITAVETGERVTSD